MTLPPVEQNEPSASTHDATPLRLVLILIVATSFLRLLLASQVGFGNDESYHYACSRHLDLSYFDHPPMHAWICRLATELGGDSPSALRAPFILLFGGTTWLLFALGRSFFGARSGFYAALLLNLAPVFSFSTAIFVLSDGPLMFFWLLCVYCLKRALLPVPSRYATLWWLAAGVALGLGLLSKYQASFLVLGTFLFILTRPDQRRWLLHPAPYLALAIAVAIFSPVLIWNARHDWVSFLFQGGRGAHITGLRPDWLGRSIGGQALWLLPWIWVPLVWQLAICLRCRSKDATRWFVAMLAAPPIFFFTTVALYAPIGFLFHWQAPGYLLLFLPLGNGVVKLLHDSRYARRTRRWLWFSAVTSPTAFLFLSSQAATGWVERILPTETSESFVAVDPTLESLDYETLPDALANWGLLERNDLFAFSPKWYVSGKIEYALRGRLPVLCLSGDDPRSYAFFEEQRRYLGKDALMIQNEHYGAGFENLYAKYFERITCLGVVDVPRGKKSGVKLKVFYCEKFISTVAQPYGLSRDHFTDR